MTLYFVKTAKRLRVFPKRKTTPAIVLSDNGERIGSMKWRGVTISAPRSRINLLPVLLTALLLTGCDDSNRVLYQASQRQLVSCQRELDRTTVERDRCRVELADCRQRLAQLERKP